MEESKEPISPAVVLDPLEHATDQSLSNPVPAECSIVQEVAIDVNAVKALKRHGRSHGDNLERYL